MASESAFSAAAGERDDPRPPRRKQDFSGPMTMPTREVRTGPRSRAGLDQCPRKNDVWSSAPAMRPCAQHCGGEHGSRFWFGTRPESEAAATALHRRGNALRLFGVDDLKQMMPESHAEE